MTNSVLGLGQRVHAEVRTFIRKRNWLKVAIRQYEKGSKKGNLDDYKEALKKHWVSYSEYANEFEFYNKSEKEREEFVSELKMKYFYWRYVPETTKPYFRNKLKFLKTFDSFIHRKWLYAPESTIEDFEDLVSKCDCIVKPTDGRGGRGVFKICKNTDHQNNRKLFETCVRNKMLVEECIEQYEELKALHPESLNTIRVVTVSNKKKAEVFGGVLRIGVGDNVVDNARAGGIFAQINIKNGIIESDGKNHSGQVFERHPDSNIVLKGFKIPQWDAIVETCCQAATVVGNTITGWDVAINSKGEVDFVEGNNFPDFILLQSPLQIGLKKNIYAKIKEYCGVEMDLHEEK